MKNEKYNNWTKKVTPNKDEITSSHEGTIFHITYTLENEVKFLANMSNKESAENLVKAFKEINPTIEVRMEEI